VNVTETAQPNITVISPNGGETWTTYDERAIKWTWSNAKRTDKVDLYLEEGEFSCRGSCGKYTYTLDKNISVRSTYNWIVATDVDNKKIPAGNYRMLVCQAGSQTKCDSSDNYFTIAAPARLMQICPQTKVINRMPQVAPVPPSTTTPSVYFIMNGTRWELEHFDLDWVTRNCSVKEETVY
jgi:hypothetical protein